MKPSLLVAGLLAPLLAVPGLAADWDGFYAGLLAAPVSSATQPCCSLAIDTLQFSGVAGFGMQLGPLVAGVEAEASPMRASTAIATNPVGLTGAWTLDTLAAVRVRAGVDVLGLLPFATAGVVAGSGSVSLTGVASAPAFYTGWTVGAGIEAPVLLGLRLRAEYQYANFGNAGFGAPLADPFAAAFVTQTVKAGVILGF